MQNLGLDYIIKGLPRLMEGMLITIKIAGISLVLSIIFGFILGIFMTSKNKILNFVLRILLEAFRLIHPLIWLFLVFFGVSLIFHIQTDNVVVSIVVFTLWGSFEIGDLVRSYIKSLPINQFESSMAIGLNKRQMFIYVLIPQILIRVTPSIVNLATRLIKTTSLVFLIGVPELLKVSQSIIQVAYYNNPNSTISFTMYLFLLILYFCLCYPLSLLARFLEKKVSLIS